MRTLLTQFCEQFEGIARPLLDPVNAAVDALSVSPFDLPARRILPGLRDVRHQFDSLVDKVAGQHSYVLIFGPLKSGKSTLMNAVAASYVSEVTCLPAYPCMVYVTHKDARELKVTRYDGQSSYYTDPQSLRKALTRAHADLAEKIRARGDGEETFDPAVHFPEAIRRVDVSVPANQLGKSGAVLVDTPGLYARMRFGYDRMTREFRNSAACAVFVVKTDNLFLEQVFEEFGRLLDLFSRVFLVVNLDSTKRDLLPDGSLSPSLEHDDPQKVVEAFERLSMDAPLRAAYLEGKLKIYPVDLLRAANRRLRSAEAPAVAGAPASASAAASRRDDMPAVSKGAGSTGMSSNATSSAGAKPASNDVAKPSSPAGSSRPSGEPAKPVGEIADFERFRDDLTAYLNSNEYLRAFLGDSLKHADALLRETELLCDMGPVKDMASRVQSLREDREQAKRTVDQMTAAQALDWKAAFAGLSTRLADGTRERLKEVHVKTADAVGGVLDRWFASDRGLASLEDEAGALFASCLREAGPAVLGVLKTCASDGSAGARVPFEVKQTLTDLGVSLDAISRAAFDKVDPLAGIRHETPRFAIEDIPVRRSLWDLVTFHGAGRMRRTIFGTRDALTSEIPASTKQGRLGTRAREALRKNLIGRVDAFFPQAASTMLETSLSTYMPAVVSGVAPEIQAKKDEASEVHADAERRLSEVANVVESLTRLRKAMEDGVRAVDALTKRHAETDPALLNRPIESATGPDDRDATSRGRKIVAA